MPLDSASAAGNAGLIPGQGTKILHASMYGQNNKKENNLKTDTVHKENHKEKSVVK